MKAIVVGAGIGGLAAGLALRRVGIEVEVLERAPELREVGAGLSIWSNAVRALRRLGVADAVVAAGSPITSARTLDARGRVLSDADLTAIGARLGEPSVCVHRADLQRLLLEAFGAERVHTASTCVGVREDGDRVHVALEGGRTVAADLLVGADGIHSAVRRAVFGLGEPRYAGYTAWRGLARFTHADLLSGRTVFCLGRGCQAGVARCGEGRVYWFATQNTPRGGQDGPAGARAAVLEAIAGWPEVVRGAVEASAPADVFRSDVIDRPPTKAWGRGRVTLLGDAVHPTTPNLGQGACQALEDAVALGAALRGASDPALALRAYEDARRERGALVTTTSWRLGQFFQVQNPLLVWLRDTLSATRLGQRQGEASLATFVAHDSPALD